jgi:hypothetical protein
MSRSGFCHPESLEDLCAIGLRPGFWLGFVAVAIVLGLGNMILQRRRAQKAQEKAMRLDLEKQKQDRSLL